MFRALIAAAFVLSAAVAASTPARAEYSLCNLTSYALTAAIGFPDDSAVDTRGWWALKPGQCRIVLTEKIGAGQYYVFAEAINGHRGDQRVWTGSVPLCVAGDGFFTIKNDGPCEGEGRSARPFTAVDVEDTAAGQWRTDFTEAEDFSNLHRAETAGVQRLLSDVGYDVGGIDGFMGQKTRESLADFKRQNGLADPSEINDELIDALIAAANTRETDLGLFFCNDHQSPIWTALAASNGEAVTSRGWWRLNPDECTKIIKGALSDGEYYVYASADGGNGDTPLSGGDQPFCLNTVMFEIGADANCDDEGYEAAAFKRIETGAAESFTHRFAPSDFQTDG